MKKTKRPTCSVMGCKNPAHHTGTKNPDGSIRYRRRQGLGWICSTHHEQMTHSALKHRKNFCENIDGRLNGRPCTTDVHWIGMLDVDHIDGDPSNNHPSNLQTLCKCCHAYKTHIYKDSRTPGRKTLGLTGYLNSTEESKKSDTVVFPTADDRVKNSGLFIFDSVDLKKNSTDFDLNLDTDKKSKDNEE